MTTWQRYTNPTALKRMRRNLCPECGKPADAHTGLGGAQCGLTDMGVSGRIWQYKLDRDRTA